MLPQMAAGSPLSLQYSVCAREDPRDMFLYAAGTLWPLPNGQNYISQKIIEFFYVHLKASRTVG